MAKYRRGRINEEMFKEVAQIIRNVKDPRVSQNFVSITGVDVTPDLKYAKIYYSALHGDKKEVQRGLASSAGYIRSQLARNLNLRMTPELTFCEDTSIAYGAHIEKVISGFTYSDDVPSANDDTDHVPDEVEDEVAGEDADEVDSNG